MVDNNFNTDPLLNEIDDVIKRGLNLILKDMIIMILIRKKIFS